MPVKPEIKFVTEAFIKELIESGSPEKGYFPIGRFLSEDAEGRFLCVDNSTGNGWVEDFPERGIAERWLRGEIEIDGWDRRTKRDRLKRAENFRRAVLDEVLEAIAFDGVIENWRDAAAIVENLKEKKSPQLKNLWHA